MKKIILSIIILLLLFSCSKKEQYYGIWSLHPIYDASPYYIKIEPNSISLSEYGNHWSTYPIIIKNNNLTFSDHTFNTSITKDSLIFNNSVYKRDSISSTLEIELPNIISDTTKINKDEVIYNISYGKKPNSNEFAFQLNDKYGSFSDIRFFYSSYSCSGGEYAPIRTLLVCDENVKIKDLERLFLELIKTNVLTVYTVNTINYNINNDSITHRYSYQKQRLPHIFNFAYNQKISNEEIQIQNIYSFPINPFEHIQHEKAEYVFLIENDFYYQKEKNNLEALTTKVEKVIAENTPLIALFDLESNYKNFLIFNAIINDSYTKLYDKNAKEIYNATYEELSDDKQFEIRSLRPKIIIQNYSIPHFLSFEESPDENTKFPFKNVKEKIPAEYFKQLE